MLVSGTVRDSSSGAGVSNVLVSNGEHVVETGPEGAYRLEVEPGGHAFVWTASPAGFRPAERFYQPVPDGAAREDHGKEVVFDFELLPAPERSDPSFRLAHITDIHLVLAERYPSWELASTEILRQSLETLIQRHRPDLIIAGGDLTNHGYQDEMEAVHQVLSEVQTPLFPLCGNHDGSQERRLQLASEGKTDRTFTRHYERFFGPPYYSFDWGSRHFVLYMDFDRCFSPADQVRKAAWLRADLGMQPKGKEILVVLHGPPPGGFIQELSRFRVSAVLYGHRHSSKVMQQDGMAVVCTPSLCFGGTDNAPAGYRLLDFSAETTRYHLAALQGRTLRAPAPADLMESSGELKLVWRREVPGDLHRAGPIYVDGDVFVSLRGEDFQDRVGVLCLDGAEGADKWHFRTESSVKNSVALGADGSCAAASVSGRIYLLDAATGVLRWAAQLPGYPELFVYTTPRIAGSSVYVGEKGICGALDLTSGEMKWSRSLDRRDESTASFRRGVAGRDVPCYAGPLVFRQLLMVLVPGRGLLALHQESGEIAWEVELTNGKLAPAAPALEGEVLVSAGDVNKLMVLTASTGEVLWHREVLEGDYPTGLAVAGERIYVTTPVGGVRCFDLWSGDLQWRFETGPDLLDMIPRRRGLRSLLATPVFWHERLIVGANDGLLYLLDSTTGACTSRLDLGAPISATPCIDGDRIWVGTFDGRLYCFQVC